MLIEGIVKRYRWQLIFTLSLIVSEALLGILFPLFIGKAIGGVLNKETTGLWLLGILGILLVFIGGFRRMYDSRFYARVYTQLSSATLNRMPKDEHSTKTARLSMLLEMVKFAEFQFPDIIQHSIGLIGVLTIIAFLNLNIFLGALISGTLVIGLYLLSGKKTFLFNRDYNNELEKQVAVISRNRQSELKLHLLKLMRWNIKLSDIETINYSLSWLFMLLLLLAAIALSAWYGNIEYGALFALIMYVYQYIESMVSLPLYYQEWLRLTEITQRIRNFNKKLDFDVGQKLA